MNNITLVARGVCLAQLFGFQICSFLRHSMWPTRNRRALGVARTCPLLPSNYSRCDRKKHEFFEIHNWWL